MLRIYAFQGDHLAQLDALPPAGATVPVVWLDLLNPSPEEDKMVEAHLGLAIPTRAEMDEIELSARLYQQDGAEFMTMTALINLNGDDPAKTPVTFILKGPALVSVRFAEPKPFQAYLLRATKPNGIPCALGELVMLGLIEALVDRMADALERVGSDIDAMSRGVFRNRAANAAKKTDDLQTLIEQIGREGDLLTLIRESLVSITRLVTYRMALDSGEHKIAKEARQRIKLVQRDAASLVDHAMFLSGKINFLLDATLGLITLEQNKIIKIFSIASVVFLPPTLIASIYGMNFHEIPELSWIWGYPYAIALMILSAIMPFVYFRRRGWL